MPEVIINEAMRNQNNLIAQYHQGKITPINLTLECDKIWRLAMNEIIRKGDKNN
jgi:hypothetical protein